MLVDLQVTQLPLDRFMGKRRVRNAIGDSQMILTHCLIM